MSPYSSIERVRRYKQLAFYVTTWNLVQDFATKFTKLELLFGGKPIRTISVSKISIWNEGNETIHASDIADADRLRLSVVDGAELLMNSGRHGSRARCCSVDKCLKTLISLEISDTCFHWTTGNPDLIPNWIPKGVLAQGSEIRSLYFDSRSPVAILLPQ